MNIVAFDTGWLTGIVSAEIFPEDLEYFYPGNIISHRTVKAHELKVPDELTICDLAILERLPAEKSQDMVLIERTILISISVLGVEFKYVAPSEWKPVAKAREWSFKEASTVHESDAYLLLRYYIWKTWKKDLLCPSKE